MRARLDSSASPLRRQRLLQGLSTQQLADRAGLGRRTVVRAEQGNASSETWWALSTALGVPRSFIDAEHAERVAAEPEMA